MTKKPLNFIIKNLELMAEEISENFKVSIVTKSSSL